MNEENLIKHYNKHNEDKRLKTRHAQVEYITGLTYIKKYLKKNRRFGGFYLDNTFNFS